MAKYHVVIADVEKAHAFEQRRHREAYARAGVTDHDQAARLAAAHVGAKRAKGTRHADGVESDCPLGRPNCRNCGDPAHAEACHAAGHCPDCGTKHGIAPDATLSEHGFMLEPA